MKIQNGLLYKVSGGWSNCVLNVTYDGLALNACLDMPKLLFIQDDEIYFSDNRATVRKITKERYIMLLSGSGSETINPERIDQKFDEISLSNILMSFQVRKTNDSLTYYFITSKFLVKVEQDNTLRFIVGRGDRFIVQYSVYQYGLVPISFSKIFKIYRNGDYLFITTIEKSVLYRLSFKTGFIQKYFELDLPYLDSVVDTSTNEDIYFVSKNSTTNNYQITKFNIYSKSFKKIAGSSSTTTAYQYDGQSSLDIAIKAYNFIRYFNGSIYYSTTDQYRIIQVDLSTLTVKSVLGLGYRAKSVAGLYSYLENAAFYDIGGMTSDENGNLFVKNLDGQGSGLILKIDNNNKVIPYIGKMGNPFTNFENYPAPAESVTFKSFEQSMVFHPVTKTLFFTTDTSTKSFILEYVNSTNVRKIVESTNSIKGFAIRNNGNLIVKIGSTISEYNLKTNTNTNIVIGENVISYCVLSDDTQLAYAFKFILNNEYIYGIGFYTFSTKSSTLSKFTFRSDVPNNLFCGHENKVYISGYDITDKTKSIFGTLQSASSSFTLLSKAIAPKYLTFYNGTIYGCDGKVLYKMNSAYSFIPYWDGSAYGKKRGIEYQPMSEYSWNIAENGDIYFLVNGPMMRVIQSERMVVEIVGNGTIAEPTIISTSTILSNPVKDGSFIADSQSKYWYDPTTEKYFKNDAYTLSFSTITKDDDIIISSVGIESFMVNCERDKFGYCLQKFTCFNIFYNNETACSGNGDCTDLDMCECFDSFFGDDCSETINNTLNQNVNDSRISNSTIDFISLNNTSLNSTFNSTVVDLKNNSTSDNSKINETRYDNSTDLSNNSINSNITNTFNSTCFNNLTNSTNLNSTNLNSTDLHYDNITYVNQTIFNATNSSSSSNNTHNNTTVNNITNINNSTISPPSIQCYGYISNDSRVCSGNGVCISNNSCQCSELFEGLTCDSKKFSCFGILHTNPNACSGHGKCVSEDVCQCFDDYFGSKCFALISSPPNFNSLGNLIEFHFNTSSHVISNSILECKKIVNENSLILLGNNPSCYWKDGNFFIELGGQYSLTPFSTILLKVNMIVDNLNTQNTSSIPLLILPSNNPVKPIINVSYKNVISSCEEISIDASGSFCGDLKPVKFIWSIESSPDPNFNLQQLTFGELNSTLKSNYTSISGKYMIGLIVESSLNSGAKSDKQIIEITKSSVPNPTLSLVTSKSTLINIEMNSLPIIVKKSIELPSCYFENKEIVYIWDQISGSPINYHIDVNNDLVISGISENGDKNYVFSVKAISIFNSLSNTSMLVSISSKSSELSLNIYLSNLNTTLAETIIEYSDPDNVSTVSDVWNWSCFDRVSNQLCQDSKLTDILAQCSISKSILCLIPKYSSPSISLTLTISKRLRSITKSINLDYPSSQSVIPPLISLISVTPNRVKVLRDEILSLQLSVILGGEEKLTNEQDMLREWSINGNALSGSMISKMSIEPSKSSSLILSLSDLVEGAEYEIKFKVTDLRNSLSSTFYYKFAIVKSPKSCLCYVSPSSGYALETKFSFSCPGCQNVEQSIDFIFGFKDDKSGTRIPLYNLGESFSSYLPSSYMSKYLDTFIDIVDLDTGASVEFIKPVEIYTPLASSLSQVKSKTKAWSTYSNSLLPSDSAKLVFNSASISRTSELMISKLPNSRQASNNIVYELREDILNSMILGLNQRNSLELLSDVHFRVYIFGLESIASNSENINSLPFQKILNITERIIDMAHQNSKFRVAEGAEMMCNSLMDNIMRLLSTSGDNQLFYGQRLLNSMKKFNSLVLRNVNFGQKDYKVSFTHFSSISVLNYKNQLVKKTLTSDDNCTAIIEGIGSEISNRVVLETSMISTDDFFGISDILKSFENSKMSQDEKFKVKTSYKLLSQIVSIENKYNPYITFIFNLGNNYNMSKLNIETKVDQTVEISSLECIPTDNLFSQRNQTCFTTISYSSVYCNCSHFVTSLIVIEKTVSTTHQLETPNTPNSEKTISNMELYGLFGLFGLLAICIILIVVVILVIVKCLRKNKTSTDLPIQKEVELLSV